MKTKPDKSTEANREFWRFVERCRQRVKEFPDWARGTIEREKDSD